MRWLLPVLASASLLACDAQTPIEPSSDDLRPVTTVSLSATDRLAQSSNMTGGTGAQAVGVFEGRAAIGTRTGLLATNTNAVDALAPVQVMNADAGMQDVGAVSFVGRRGTSGALIISDLGLFHDRDGVLLESPLTGTLEGHQIYAVDSFGSGASEELWLLSTEGLLYVANSQLQKLKLSGVDAKPEAAVAIAAGKALVVAEGSLFEVSLSNKSATRIHKDMGHVASFERSDDGSVYFATDEGLLEVKKSGELQHHTFAANGEPARAVSAVAAAFGSVVASTDADVFSLESSGTVRIGQLAGVLTRGLAVDSAGDTFAATATTLRRFKTGKPVSFATDVKPFFSAHCMSCHLSGTSGARAINFEDYETAKANAGTALTRLNAVNTTPMPPVNVETLTAADYAVVTRWVGGGMAP